MSPTQRSLAMLRATCQQVQVVERWCSYSRRRIDLYGVVDILCLRDGETVAVQTTSGGCVSARLKKISDCPALPDMRKAGWRIEVHGWRKVRVKGTKKQTRWECRIVDVS
jgi:hypothetical protein